VSFHHQDPWLLPVPFYKAEEWEWCNLQGHIIHSEQPTRSSHLNEVLCEEKIAVTFQTNLFTKKINGIILEDMTTPNNI
jgi:hypothetical protein